MGWPKGTPRPERAGRKKGTPNKDVRSLQEICEKKGVNPFEALLDLYVTSVDEGIRLGAIKEAAKYIYPQRKAIEHTGEIQGGGSGIQLTIAEIAELVRGNAKID